jgi:hypothetical protein
VDGQFVIAFPRHVLKGLRPSPARPSWSPDEDCAVRDIDFQLPLKSAFSMKGFGIRTPSEFPIGIKVVFIKLK